MFFLDGFLHVEYDDYWEDHPILRGFPSGKLPKNYGTSPCLMGKSTIKWYKMAMFFFVFKFLVGLRVYQKVSNLIQFIHSLHNMFVITPVTKALGSSRLGIQTGRSSGDHGSDQFRAGGPVVSWALGPLGVGSWKLWETWSGDGRNLYIYIYK